MLKSLILRELFHNNIIKIGEFTLKNKGITNSYIDMRSIISHTFCFSLIVQELSVFLNSYSDVVLCGVPHGAVPIATALSLKTNIQQIMLRKTRKQYGLQRLVEGNALCKKVVIIEDVVTTGSSINETIETLKLEGYEVVGIICILIRENDVERKFDVPFHYLFKMENIKYPYKISLRDLNTKIETLKQNIKEKKSNIILAYDKPKEYLFNLLDKINNNIVGLKIHSEILNLSVYEELQLIRYCKNNNIFLWEDRKYNDINNTVEKQIKKYEGRRDFISIVPTSGPHILNCNTNIGFFVLCEMSSKNNLFNCDAMSSILHFVEKNHNNVVGLICQNEKLYDLPFLSITPGIHIHNEGDSKGQQYKNPHKMNKKPSLFVVGRAITESDNPVETIKQLNTI